MRRNKWLWIGALLVATLPLAPTTRAQAPAEPVCAPGSTDPKCQSMARIDGFWLDHFGQVPAGRTGEWFYLESTPGTETLTGEATTELVAIQDGAEVGRVAFAEAPESRFLVYRDIRTTADGTPVEVVLETVAGTVAGSGHSQALGGLRLTATKPGMAVQLLRPLAIGSDLAQVTVTTSRAAARLHPSSNPQIGGSGPIPPVLEDPSICLPFGEEPDTTCGAPFCDAYTALFEDSFLCLAATVGTVATCATAATPFQWALCLIGIYATYDACDDVLDDLSALETVRREAEECYCTYFAEYSAICDEVPHKEISARATGLRPGESVEAIGSCGSASGEVTASSTRLLEYVPSNVTAPIFHFPKSVIYCPTSQFFRVESGRVATPGVATENQRTCTPNPRGWYSVAGTPSLTVELDCRCNDPLQCPSVELYASVQGLDPADTTSQVRLEAITRNPTTPTGGHDFPTAHKGVISDDGDLVLSPEAYAGMRITGYNQFLPAGCQVSQYLVPEGSEIPPPSVGTRRLKVADIRCNTQNCDGNNLEECNVEARLNLRGSSIGRPAGVAVSLTLNGEQIERTLTSGSTVIGTVPAGSSFENLTVLNEEVSVGPLRVSICTPEGATSGEIGQQSPAVLGTIECELRTLREGDPEPPGPRPTQTECTKYCVSDTTFTIVSSYDNYGNVSYRFDLHETLDCETWCRSVPGLVTSNFPASRYFGPTLDIQVSSPKDDGDEANGMQADSEIIVEGSAIDPQGINGFHVFLDDQLVHTVTSGGHLAAVLAPVTLDLTALTPGPHTLWVRATDNSGEYGAPTVMEMPFTIAREPQGCAADTAGPVLSFSSPTPGQLLSPGTVAIHVDAEDTSQVSWVQFYLDGEYQGSDGNWPYQYNWAASPGTHELMVVAQDSCGNYGEATIEVTVTDPCQGGPGPTVQITSFADGAWLEPESYTVIAEATPSPGQSVSSVTFQVGSYPSVVDTEAPWRTGEYFLLTEGQVTISAEARDTCGRTARQEIQVNISGNASLCEVDDGPPTATIIAPLASAVIPPGPVTVIGDVTEDGVLFAGALEVDGVVSAGDTVLSSNPAAYRWTWNAPPGTHTLRLRVSDVCRNLTVSEPITVTVNAYPPLGEPELFLLPADLRVLDGPTLPVGPLLRSVDEIDFGDLAAGRAGAVRTVSLLNDGHRNLTISSASITGTAFAFDPVPTLPFVVPSFRGEAFLRIKPTGLGVGPVQETLTVVSDLGTFTVLLKALVDPNAHDGLVRRLISDFEEGNLAEWTSATAGGVSANAQAAAASAYGMRVGLSRGVGAYFVTHVPPAEGLKEWRMKFAIRPGELQLAEGATMVVASGVKSGSALGWIVVRRIANAYQAQAISKLDSGAWAATPWVALPVGYSTLDLLWWTASSVTAADGGIRLVTSNWTVVESLGLQNFQNKTERFRLGAGFGAPAGTSGVLDYDDVTIWY